MSEVLTLQRLIGNRTVTGMLADGRLPVAEPVIQRQLGLKEGTKVRVKHTFPGNKPPENWGVITNVVENGSRYTVRFEDDELNAADSADRTYAENLVTGPALPIWSKPQVVADAEMRAKLDEIAENASKPTELSDDQIERMLNLLVPPDPPSRSKRPLPPKKASERNKNAQIQPLVAALELDMEQRKDNEAPNVAKERETRVNADIEALKDEAFQARFDVKPENAKFADLKAELEVWFKEVQAAEGKIEFQAAFTANRMTARQINATGRRGKFQVRHYGDKPDKNTDREMSLDNTPAGIAKRGKPENFVDQSTINREGVHDLSASLLQGEPLDRGIFQQLKYYKNAVVVFMPLPEESDLRIFAALAKVQGMDPAILAEWGRLLTRPVLAQASDMGTVYVDTQPGKDGEGSFAYGLTGTAIRAKGERARNINAADLAERRRGALAYKAIATSGITRVNEVVMAYRKHQSENFPMFARWDDIKGHFVVLDAQQNETKQIITNRGELK